jgi:hypothetical protein
VGDLLLGIKNKTLEDKILEIEKAFEEYFEVEGKRNLEALVSSVLQVILDEKRGIDRRLLSVVLRKISADSNFFVYYRRRFILIGEKYLVKRRLYYLLKHSPEHFLKTDADIRRLSSYLFNTKISIFAFDRATKLQKSLEFRRGEFLESIKSAAKKDGVFAQVEIYTDFINRILYLVLLPSISDKVSKSIGDVLGLYSEIVQGLEKDIKKRSKFYPYVYGYVKYISTLRTVYNSFLSCGMEDFYYKLIYDYMFLLSDISGSKDFVNSDYMFFADYCCAVLLNRYILAKKMAEDYKRKLESEKGKLVSSKKAEKVYLKTLEFVEKSLLSIDEYIEALNRMRVGINSIKS